LKAAAAEIELRFRPGPMHLAISDGVQDIVRVVIDPTQNGKELQIEDRAVSFAFTHDAAYRLHIFLDGSVVECFLNGRLVLTVRTYRAPKASLHFQIPPEELPALESLRVWSLRPISADRLTT
jgi:glycosyl hydrolase family 32